MMSELVGLLLDLRAWAREGEEALARAMEHYDRCATGEASEVGAHLAGLTAARWRALDVLIGQRLAAARARLAAAVAEAEAKERHWIECYRALSEQGTHRLRGEALAAWSRRCTEAEGRAGSAQVAAEAARAALAAFDAAVEAVGG